MRTLILIASLAATLVFGIASLANATVCETHCDGNNCVTRCHH